MEIVKEFCMAISFGVVALAVFFAFMFLKKKMGVIVAILCGIVMFVVAIGGGIAAIAAIDWLFPDSRSSPPSVTITAKQDPEAERKARIEKQFSSWDGSHRKLTALIKQSMNDPGSYQHVETRYGDRGDYLLVKTTFRGKNMFNATVVNSVMAKIGLDGEVIEIIEEQ